jgi:hypothetical protein
MKEHIYDVNGTEFRVRYYSDRLELVIAGATHSFPSGQLIKYVRNACNVYLSEYPLDGEVIFQQEEDLLDKENKKDLPPVDNPVAQTVPGVSEGAE